MVDLYEESFLGPPTSIWLEMSQLLGIKRHIRNDECVFNTVNESS